VLPLRGGGGDQQEPEHDPSQVPLKAAKRLAAALALGLLAGELGGGRLCDWRKRPGRRNCPVAIASGGRKTYELVEIAGELLRDGDC
jgi:hypothetical protein